MSKLLQDPKVAELVATREAKARMAERKRVLGHTKTTPLHEDKAVAKHQKTFLAQLVTAVKGGE